MFCLQCGNNVKDGVRFCGNCGWAVQPAPPEKRCASCGTMLKDEAKFCPNCGLAVPALADVPVPVSSDSVPAPETKGNDKPEPKKSGAVDKVVFHHLGSQIYTCYLYKDGVVVGNMTDTHGAFIHDTKEWLEAHYENLVVETV